jgi:hypothetical protein
MLPVDLKPDQFRVYPAKARKLALDHLDALKRLPVSFLPSLLREVIAYDWKFPSECKQLDSEIANIASLSADQVNDWFQEFTHIGVSEKLERLDWVSAPGEFVEQLSAYLWTTHQLDDFRRAAITYAERLNAATPPEPLPAPRLGIVVIGQGVEQNSYPLFRKLRPYGVYFNMVRPDNGLALLLDAVAERAHKYPVPYGHWYVDGGEPRAHDAALTCISYGELGPARAALLHKMQTEIQSPGMGPEALRTILAQMTSDELSLPAGDSVLNRFRASLLTEGSGTQVFSTTFAQWAAREVFRRAQPLSLLVRFAPRQRQKPMNELLSGAHSDSEVDVSGSLIDADMGAYYNWLSQQRLPGAQQSSFLAWFENHSEALLIAPSLPRGTRSSNSASIPELLKWMN